ncbi:MAG: phage holin family protein [Holophagaceae bacterium]|nr:phage holin family protein [Holophagaceae bacterium]
MRALFRFLFSALGLLVASVLVPGIGHGSFVDLLLVAVLLGALNATLGLLLRFVAFVPIACSFGCLSLFINGLVFWLAGRLAASLGLGFSVAGFWSGFFGALVSSFVAWVLDRVCFGSPDRTPPPGPRPGGERPIKVVDIS